MSRRQDQFAQDLCNERLVEMSGLYATVEERIDKQPKPKRLDQCALPAGYWLETRQPRQMWMDGQLRRVFCLGWRSGKDQFFHVARYEDSVADEIQLVWALDDFSCDLREAGYDGGERVKASGKAKAGSLKIKINIRLKSALLEAM